MAKPKTRDDDLPRYRCLAIDGGGLYGYISALWLRQLCDRDPEFLKGQSVDLYAGISSGAVNSLLLAKYENPRDAVLSGELESFWTARCGVFSNSNPLFAYLSLCGVTGWYGMQDFLDQLEQHFGDRTLGDLPQKVIICTFNMSGKDKPIDFGPRHPHGGDAGRFLGTWAQPTSNEDSWRPKIFTNFRTDRDQKYRVVDVAYGAATPVGFRAVRGGITDGAIFTANPSLNAIGAMVHVLTSGVYRDQYPDAPRSAGGVLDQLSLLSVGDGSISPHYWLKNFDFSLMQVGMFPTNPPQGQWYPPSFAATLDAPAQDTTYVSKMLLNNRFHRIDPGLMNTPVLISSIIARFPMWRDLFLQRMRTVINSQPSVKAVDDVITYLANGWQDPIVPPNVPPS